MDTVGIRNGGGSTLTITGGSDNGANYGAQLDLIPSSSSGHAQLQAGTSGNIYFRTGNAGGSPVGGYARMIIYSDGLVEIYDQGADANRGNLSIANAAEADSFNTRSSILLKTNIKPLQNALTTVKKLNGVTFDWKESGLKDDFGFIAEEVEKILPTLVKRVGRKKIRSVD